MPDFVTITSRIVDKIAEAINGLDFNPTVTNYSSKIEGVQPGKYSVNIIPKAIKPVVMSSHSSYPIVMVDVMVNYFSNKDRSIQDEYVDYMRNLNKVFNVLDHNFFNGLVSVALATVRMGVNDRDTTEITFSSYIEMEYRRYSFNA